MKPIKEFSTHSIVKVGGRWGVICVGPGPNSKTLWYRIVDFWDGGLEIVPSETMAKGLPPGQK